MGPRSCLDCHSDTTYCVLWNTDTKAGFWFQRQAQCCFTLIRMRCIHSTYVPQKWSSLSAEGKTSLISVTPHFWQGFEIFEKLSWNSWKFCFCFIIQVRRIRRNVSAVAEIMLKKDVKWNSTLLMFAGCLQINMLNGDDLPNNIKIVTQHISQYVYLPK